MHSFAGLWKMRGTLPLEPSGFLLLGFGLVSVAVCQATAHGSSSSGHLLKCFSCLGKYPCSWQVMGQLTQVTAPGSGLQRVQQHV